MSSVLRAAKYSMKGYNGVQTKVRDATSNDPQPPTGSMLNELSQLTYNPDDFLEIALVLGKRLDDKGRNWRHVYKSLIVLDYLLHSGSEAVVLYFQKNAYVIKTLKEFQYVDEEGKDQGANIRIKATDIANLLLDEARLRQIRRSRAEMRDRMLGRLPRPESGVIDEDLENENIQRRSALLVPPENDDEDAVRVQSAMAQIRQARAAEEKDLLRAFKLSQDDENKRTQAVQQAVVPSPLFDEPVGMSATTPSVTTPTVTTPTPQTTNEPAPLVVFDGMDQMTTPQPPPQVMPQVVPQFTSFNPFLNLQAQQEMLQAEQLRQQQEWINLQAAQQQLQQQQEEWLRQQMLHQQQQAFQQQQQQQQQHQAFQFFQPQASPILPQQPSPARSNNPFALSASPLFSSVPQASSLPSPTSSSPSPTLLTPSSPEPPSNAFLTSQQPQRKPSPFNAQHLDQLFANRDDAGMDTFGNVGQLRFGHNFPLQSA